MRLSRKVLTIIFLTPLLIMFSIFIIYPFINTIFMSFFSWEGWKSESFIGIGNFAKVLSSSYFVNLKISWSPPFGSLINNILWMGIQLPITIFGGVFLAILFRGVKGGVVLKSIVFLGMVIPLILTGMLVRFIFDAEAGIVSSFFDGVGVEGLARTWTASSDLALYALILGSTFFWIGFPMIVYSAALETIPQDFYEAAEIDGASRWKIFWRIEFPLLKPATLIVFVMTFIWIMRMFDIVWITTRGGPGLSTDVLATWMYREGFIGPVDPGISAAIATIMTLLVLPIGILGVRVLLRK